MFLKEYVTTLLCHPLQVHVALQRTIHAEYILLKSNQRKVELLLNTEALEEPQIILRQLIHHLQLSLLQAILFLALITLITTVYFDQVDIIQPILLSVVDGLIDLDLGEIEELLVSEGVVDDRDVLDDRPHLVAQAIELLPSSLDPTSRK